MEHGLHGFDGSTRVVNILNQNIYNCDRLVCDEGHKTQKNPIKSFKNLMLNQ
jgi:hypothetical protein